MSAPDRLRFARRLGATLTACALALSSLLTVGVCAAQATPSTQVSVSMTALHGGLITESQPLSVIVTVTNQTSHSVPAGSATLWIDSSPQSSRSDLVEWLAEKRSVKHQVSLGTVATPAITPRSSASTRITIPNENTPYGGRSKSLVLGLGATVQIDKQTLTTRGCVTWVGTLPTSTSDVAMVMPIVSPSTGSGILSATDLATDTGPDGILTHELDAAAAEGSVALGIDPLIIASIKALGNSAPPSALLWLRRLAAMPNETFSLGYGDADITAQIQAGIPHLLTLTSLSFALDPKNFSPEPTPIGEAPTQTGSASTPAPVGVNALPTLASLTSWNYSLGGIGWTADATLETDDVEPLAASGLTTLIISSNNTTTSEDSFVANPVTSSGNSTLVVSDHQLSLDVRIAAAARDDLTWNQAMSRVYAQLQLVTASAPPGHHILISLDRSIITDGDQLQRTLQAVNASPWSTPEAFSTLLSTPRSDSVTLRDSRASAERISSVRQLLRNETDLNNFSSILSDPESMNAPTRAELLTLLAVSWTNPRSNWTQALSNSYTATRNTLNSIQILPVENINLVSAQGSIPFTISNGLKDQNVTVLLRASPSNSRLHIDAPTPKVIPADSRGTMLVPVIARVGNGDVVLNLQLVSPTGIPIGTPANVKVQVHADWEGIGSLVALIALAALFAFGLVRGILRRRAQNRPVESPKSEDDNG